MAITTLAGLKEGIKPLMAEQWWWDVAGSLLSLWSMFDTESGQPVGIMPALSNGPSGEALTSYAGQLDIPPPISGQKIYVAGIEASTNDEAFSGIMLYDRLWHSGPFTNTTNAAQTVGSVAWPARDLNESSNGSGVGIALFSSTGAGTLSSAGNFTISYTNSDGVSGRIGTTRQLASGIANSHWCPFYLDSGDVGVRSVESLSRVGVVGTFSNYQLMAFRRICMMPMNEQNLTAPVLFGTEGRRLAIPLGLPRVFDSSVVCAGYRSSRTAIVSANIDVKWAQG